VVADLPGLIAGAAGGAGLGHQFLRHVERCRVLVHLVDLSGGEQDAATELGIVERELTQSGAADAGERERLAQLLPESDAATRPLGELNAELATAIRDASLGASRAENHLGACFCQDTGEVMAKPRRCARDEHRFVIQSKVLHPDPPEIMLPA